MTTYHCPLCSETFERESEKVWIESFCTKHMKTVMCYQQGKPTHYQRKRFPTAKEILNGNPKWWEHTTRPTYYRTPIGQRRKSYDNGVSWVENK